MLSGFEIFWLLCSLGCILVGVSFTLRRASERRQALHIPETTRIHSRASRIRPLLLGERAPSFEKSRPVAARCPRCAQTLDGGARFCGMCGLYLIERRPAAHLPHSM